MIADANYDDLVLQPGEDREFKNQFTEFLRKNMPTEEPVKKDRIPMAQTKKKSEHYVNNKQFLAAMVEYHI